ncbi:phospholipid N-methyltransferase [Bradyrhizobium yuanmingense]
MPLPSSARALKKPRLDDEVRFLRSWIEKPLHMGAVMPSGKLLARTMAHYVDPDSDAPVVELGPGTGAITSALIERGVDQKRLVLVEYNPGFCALLRDRYPQAKVVQGDAYRLRDTLWNVLSAPASAVVSGLPLVTKPMLTRLRLIRDAFTALAPRCALHPVHLCGGAADPEIAIRRVHRGLGTDLDEPSAGPRLGVSQALNPPAPLCAAGSFRRMHEIGCQPPRS